MESPDRKRLLDELLTNYNKLVRPVKNSSDTMLVKFKIQLTQILDVVGPTDNFLLQLAIRIDF